VTCPLCFSADLTVYSRDKFRDYYFCPRCTLISVSRQNILTSSEEKARYDQHNNDSEDPRYRQYFQSVVDEILIHQTPHSLGLDFGCGATTLMEELLVAKGMTVDSYDKFYRPDETIWSKKYDFIILSEVIEHLSDPMGTMRALRMLLRENGSFYIRTRFYPDEKSAFQNWYYKQDQTHINFFSEDSMTWLARELGLNGPVGLPVKDLLLIESSHKALL